MSRVQPTLEEHRAMGRDCPVCDAPKAHWCVTTMKASGEVQTLHELRMLPTPQRCPRCPHAGHDGLCPEIVNGSRCVCVDPLPVDLQWNEFRWRDVIKLDPEPTGQQRLVAVVPDRAGGGHRVHLLLPGYRTQKTRSIRVTTFCNQGKTSTTFYSAYQDVVKVTGVAHWPVSAVAAELAKPLSTMTWCALCLGRAVEHYGLIHEAMRLVVEKDVTPDG